MDDNLGSKAVRGVFWVLTEKVGAQSVNFIVTLILSRLLTPGDYGLVSLLTIFVTIAGVLTDAGFGSALVRKKNVTDLDFNSVFYLSLALAVILYAILFLCAPAIASFYRHPQLASILRVSSVSLIFIAVNSIQNAELNRKMLFHLSFRISLVSSLASAVVGVTLALMGFGPWALVWSTVSMGFVGMVARWYIISWRPRLMFSFAALKPLFSFGWKMAVSSLLESGFNNLYGLVIGRMYSGEDIAYVDRGRMLPAVLMGNVNDTLGRVAFPLLSTLQDDPNRLREVMRRMIRMSTFVVFPLMVIMSAVGRRLVVLLYGDAWLPAVPYLQIFCFTFALWPFHTINLQAMQALGRSDIFLKLEVLKKIIALIVLVAFIPIGVLPYMLAVALVLGPVSVVINAWPNKSLLDYSVGQQVRDVAPSIALSSVMAVPTIAIGYVIPGDHWHYHILCVAVQAVLGLTLYLSVAVAFRFESLMIVLNQIALRAPRLRSLARWLAEGGLGNEN